jgi:Fe-S oxidoreductase
MPDNRQAHRLMENTFVLSEFLEKKVKGYEAPQIKREAIVQGHCHHKSIMRLYDEEAVMKKMGLKFRLLDAGCCGMAGSFGFEADKHAVSLAVGERALLPAVRKAGLSTVVMADGFSCKEQIAQETPRHALHLAEVMALAIRKGPQGPEGVYPETSFVQQRVIAQKRSMKHAGLVTALLAVGAGAAWWYSRKH